MEEMLRHPQFCYTIEQLCNFMKISRQGFYKRRRKIITEKLQEELIVQRVLYYRGLMPRIGGRKLYYLLQEDFNRLDMGGRDKFFIILRNNGLLVKPSKQYARTTNSRHQYRVYKNLIKDLKIESPFSVIVSDITYIRLLQQFCYLFLVTDVYSRKIVGYHLSSSLEAQGALKALYMCFRYITNFTGMIHHSDRGVQYCCDEYISTLQNKGIRISMGEAGNPYENAIAERVNGILKYEFMLNIKFTSYPQAVHAVSEGIETYNKIRPHMSLSLLTPDQKFALSTY